MPRKYTQLGRTHRGPRSFLPPRLSEAQVRWLSDPRPYFNHYRDRTGRALIAKGVIVVTEQDFSGSGKVGYDVTPVGRAALARS